jgi:hypothetical protein
MMGPKEGLPFLERKRGLSFPHRRWGTGALREAREAVGGWEAFGLPDEATPQTPKLFLGGWEAFGLPDEATPLSPTSGRG